MTKSLIKLTDKGLFCEQGSFYIDPWQSVDRAVITHAHSDHARVGSASYLFARAGERVMRTRLGNDAKFELIDYGSEIYLSGVKLSLHPSGHILGAAQVRLEYKGEVCVVSGDYKLAKDRTCMPFEPIKCHTFITESTFGLPIYRWPSPDDVFSQISDWWRQNKESGKASLLFAYALGKSQRLLAGIDHSIGPIFTHGAVENLTNQYRLSGVSLPKTLHVAGVAKGARYAGSLVLAPPSALGSNWLKQFGSLSTAFASGWMSIRGMRRRKSIDRGFVLSDHADWTALNEAVKESEAERVIVTHGYASEFARWLKDSGWNAETMSTKFEGEVIEEEAELEKP